MFVPFQERSLTIEKLTGENARLADELRELTGDAVEKTRSSGTAPPTPARSASPAIVPSASQASKSGTRPSAGDENATDQTATESPGTPAAEGWHGGSNSGQQASKVEPQKGSEGGDAQAGAERAAPEKTNDAEPSENSPEEWDPAALERWGRAALLAFLFIYCVGCVSILVYVLRALFSVLWAVCMSVWFSVIGALGEGVAVGFAGEDVWSMEESLSLPYEVVESFSAESCVPESSVDIDPHVHMDVEERVCDESVGVQESFYSLLGVFVDAFVVFLTETIEAFGSIVFRSSVTARGVLEWASTGLVNLGSEYVVSVGSLIFASFWSDLRDGLNGIVISAFSINQQDVVLNTHGTILGLVLVYMVAVVCWRCVSAHMFRGVGGTIASIYRRSSVAASKDGVRREYSSSMAVSYGVYDGFDFGDVVLNGDDLENAMWLKAMAGAPIYASTSCGRYCGYRYGDKCDHCMARSGSASSLEASVWPSAEFSDDYDPRDQDVIRGSASSASGPSASTWPADDTDGCSPTGEARRCVLSSVSEMDALSEIFSNRFIFQLGALSSSSSIFLFPSLSGI